MPISLTHPVTMQCVEIRTVDQVVRYQVELFEDFERWVIDQKDWDALMQRFIERLAALDGTTFRERKILRKRPSADVRPCA